MDVVRKPYRLLVSPRGIRFPASLMERLGQKKVVDVIGVEAHEPAKVANGFARIPIFLSNRPRS